MKVRYYIDHETGLPHIYLHDVLEREVEEIRRIREKIVLGKKDLVLPLGGHPMADTLEMAPDFRTRR